MNANEIKIAIARGFKPVVQTKDLSCFGLAEYVTDDGWVGIRQPQEGNRLDEYPLDRLEFDPT